MSWKGRLRPRRVTAPMHVVDWMPTLAALLGHAPGGDPQWDGENIWNELAGGPRSEPRTLYWVWGGNRNRVALRRGAFKVLRNGPERDWELFDLLRDPSETKDLAARRPELLQQMLELVREERERDAR